MAGSLGVDPARCEDLGGLPPTWLSTGSVELFREEIETYAARLHAAGVDTTLDVTPGGTHGFEQWGRDTEPGRAYLDRALAWLGERLDVRR